MTFKDKVKGFLTFLDTDDANELEEVEELGIQENRRQDEMAFERVRPVSRPVSQEVPLTEAKAKRTYINNDYDNTSSYSTRANQPIQHRREEMAQQQGDNRVVIALKYPKRYEDARAIVDLLIENESVLIDFQYMMDAQARRCIDFIDGASRVLFGGLQKVGNTMYLLTPANVIVNIDELAMPNQHQDASFDYDLKRR